MIKDQVLYISRQTTTTYLTLFKLVLSCNQLCVFLILLGILDVQLEDTNPFRSRGRPHRVRDRSLAQPRSSTRRTFRRATLRQITIFACVTNRCRRMQIIAKLYNWVNSLSPSPRNTFCWNFINMSTLTLLKSCKSVCIFWLFVVII